MNHEKVIGRQANHDALSQPMQAGDRLSMGFFKRWNDGTQNEGVENFYAFQGLTEDARFETFYVDDFVGEFGNLEYLKRLICILRIL